MTPIATEWRGMDELPAPDAPVYFVRLGHVFCGFFRRIPEPIFAADGHHYWLKEVTNWMPREIPAPPVAKRPFQLWREKRFKEEGASLSPEECWDAGEADGRSEERARFAAGVEALIERWYNKTGYINRNFQADLRALAKGAAS